MSDLHLSHTTAIFVVDSCLFDPSWIYGLKMELMVCAGLFDVKIENGCIFPDLI